MRRRLPNSGESPFGLVLSLILLAGLAFLLWKGIGVLGKSSFGRFDRFNLVVGPKPVRLVSLSIPDKTAVVLDFPDDLYITDVVHGYGQYKIATVYAVGQLDKRGGETLAATVSEYVGVPVDGYLIKSGYGSVKELLLEPGAFFSAETNLTKLDFLKFALLFAQLRFDKVQEVPLAKMAGPLVLADGTTASIIDSGTLDNNLSGYFTEKRIRAENLRVEIINSTKVYGLANKAARKLSNIGISVVSLGTASPAVTSCQVQTGARNASSLTVLRISQAFSCQVKEQSEQGRADVTVVLGK